MEVRLAVESDAAAVADVLYQAFVDYESLYVPEAFRATTLTAQQVTGRFSEGPTWVAEQAGTVVGTVSAVLRGRALYIRSMAVLPTARGLGIGNKLLMQVEMYSRDRSCEKLFLSTTPFLLAAIRLYESFGFQRTPDGPHTLFGTSLFTMTKIL